MITSKPDYKQYLEQDKKALAIKNDSLFMKLQNFFMPNSSWVLQQKLRKLEYIKNCKYDKTIFQKIRYYFLKYRYFKYCSRLGVSIPENVFGPGLAIIHAGTININSRTKVGANCRIQAGVNIGASGGVKKAPKIGDNVYIGPGAKIYGDITLGNNIAVAANAAVNKSFDEDNIMIGGIPAKKIKEIDIKNIIRHL